LLRVVGCELRLQPTAFTKDSAETQPCVQSNPSLPTQGLVRPQASHCMYRSAPQLPTTVFTGLSELLPTNKVKWLY
jgi:hypothetical protein